MSNTQERMLSYIYKNGDCWEWTKSLTKGGYGQFNFDGFIVLAHRKSYEIFKGDIPDGFSVCHTCDNRKCINPDHLFVGTHLDNNRDMFSKGRGHIFDGTHILGSRHTQAKMDEAKALQVIKLRRDGLELQQIADRMGVTKQAIWSCLKGRTWSEVTGLPKNPFPVRRKRHKTGGDTEGDTADQAEWHKVTRQGDTDGG